MGASDSLLETARALLAEAGRPLNARRLLAMGAARDAWPAGLDAGALTEALTDAEGIQTLRRGVFTAGDAAPETSGTPRRTRPSKQTTAEPTPPDEGEPPADDRDRRRRKRTRSIDLVGDTPAAPLTVEDATQAARRGANDRDGLRRKMWVRIRREAAIAAGMDPAALPAEEVPEAAPAAAASLAVEVEAKPKAKAPAAKAKAQVVPAADAKVPTAPSSDAEPQAASAPAEEADPGARLKEALRRRRRTRVQSEPAPAVSPAVEAVDEPSAEAAPVPAPPADAYVEHRRAATAEHTPERRHPTLPELTATDALANAAEAALAEARSPMGIAALAKAVAAQGMEATGLSGVLRADGAQRAAAGLRPRFAHMPDGAVALWAWGLSEQYLGLEATLHEAIAGLREAARRDLLARVGSVSPAGFARIVRLLLERQGLIDLEVLHRAERSLALTGARGDGRRVVVVAHQAWTDLGAQTVAAVGANLEAFQVDEGLVITLGQAGPDAHAAAEGVRVSVWDGAALAHALEQHGVGLAEHRPVVRYLDHAFFAGLG